MKPRYSTAKVARMLGIAQPNMQRLIRQGRIPYPPMRHIGGIRIRFWTEKQIEAVRKILAKKSQATSRKSKAGK